MRKVCLLLALGVILSVSGCTRGQAAEETAKETAEEETETVRRSLPLKAPEGLEPEYGIVIWQEKKVNYKLPEGTEPELEIIETITTFKDSDYIEKVYSQNAVKNTMLPVSAVGFYYTVPEEFFELLQDVLK